MKPLNIGLWTKESGNALSHKGGFTPEQLSALEDLVKRAKSGEPVRLIVFKNTNLISEASPTHSLKVYTPASERHDDGGL